MKGKTELNKQGLFFLAIFIILGIVSFLLLRPFIISILIAMIITYMFYPLYRVFLSKIRNRNLTALIVTALIALIIFVPLSIFFNSLLSQIYSSYLSIQSLISGSAFSLENCSINPLVCRLVSIADNALKIEIFRSAWNEMMLSTANVVIKATSAFLISIPSKLFDLFLIFFTIFFLLRDYDYFSAGINSIIPLHESHRKKILKQFNDSLYAVIYGNILIALVQGVFATVGFYFLKVPSFALWGLLTTIAAMIPFIGPPAVWLPLSIVQMLRGYLSHESSILWNGIFIFIYGFCVISFIDNIMKPKLIGDRANIHPLIIFFGIAGGLAFFGFTGIFIGPIILAVFSTLVDIYRKEYLDKN